MVCVLLDIGAGSTSFVRDVKFCNLFTRTLAFCGEPDWGWLNFLTIQPSIAQRMIANQTSGSYRIKSSYSEFAFEDTSLDVVTCNAPHPFFGLPVGIEEEVKRCIKPGGIFFYAYPSPELYLPLNLGKYGFELIAKGAFPKDFWKSVSLKGLVPKRLPRIFPPSPVIRDAIVVSLLRNQRRESHTKSSSYVYSQAYVSPTYEVWQKK